MATDAEPARRQRARRSPPTKELRWFGLEIERKTNVISLVAFVLSAAGIASQAYFFLQGPRVGLQAPEQVVFYGDRAADGSSVYLKIAARMAYVNTGQPGFNDAIKRETASVQIGQRGLNFFWKKYTASDADGATFRLNPKGDALPVAVNAGSVEAHETSFSPAPDSTSTPAKGVNFMTFADFQKLVETTGQIDVVLTFETFAGARGSTTCRVVVDPSVRYYVRNGWVAPICAR